MMYIVQYGLNILMRLLQITVLEGGPCEHIANGNGRRLLQLFSFANYVQESETP